jgi:DNA-binding response OmpR family regulator
MVIKREINSIKALLLSDDIIAAINACPSLADYGYSLSTLHYGEDTISEISKSSPDILLVSGTNPHIISEMIDNIKETFDIPIIIMLKPEAFSQVTDHLIIADDFVVAPSGTKELDIRIKRLLRKRKTIGTEQITCGDLIIDLATCEVTLAGKIVSLTFKEYELLKFLVNNQGRVFSRDVLLDKVWGYDYYGGDRTVDVHVRRLRSKIEDANHSFIDTVRNIGYRFHVEQ